MGSSNKLQSQEASRFLQLEIYSPARETGSYRKPGYWSNSMTAPGATFTWDDLDLSLLEILTSSVFYFFFFFLFLLLFFFIINNEDV